LYAVSSLQSVALTGLVVGDGDGDREGVGDDDGVKDGDGEGDIE
jgi:hypothetical protein